MRYSKILILFFFIFPSSLFASEKLTAEECRIIVSDFERMSNLTPGGIEETAPDVLEQLRNGETLIAYFVAYNIYVENLFNKGNIEKAHKEIEKMLNDALDQSNKECQVIALRTKGQFYYKLGLYERAFDCFKSAMEICPQYDSDQLEYCFTWSSTLFWLVQSTIRTGRLDEAEFWISKMDEMMQWLDKTGNIDRIGYKPVMIRGLKAKVELLRGNLDKVNDLLEQCPQYILPDVPSRAYVEYYVAKMKYFVQRNMHQEALPLLDELIEMHLQDYKPIAAEYLYQKGLSLAALGRYEESSKILTEFVELKEQINKMALAQQIDEITAHYELEKLQHERDNMRGRFWVVFAICLALIIIVALIVINQKKLRRKNQILTRNISELNRMVRMAAEEENKPNHNNDQTSNNENLFEIGNKIKEYILQSKCYLRSDCSRETIREGISVSDRVLAKAILAVTGLSFVNYINQLRLNLSIELLEEKPEMTINEISTACGFGTLRQFQRIFKQHYDLSPSAYREARKNPN